jgi:hypothetical protein
LRSAKPKAKTMPLRSRAILTRARRLNGSSRPVVMLFNNPEVRRLQWLGQLPADAMMSERECMIATEVFAAEPGEPTEAFHARMCRTARERGVGLISMGYEPPAPAPAYPAAPKPVPVGTAH